MRKTVVLCLALCLLAAAAIEPVLAGKGYQRIVRLSGWVVDEDAGADHANAASKDAVIAKVEEGVALVFYTDKGEAYPIVDQETALTKIGEPWDVIGSLDEDENLNIGSYIKPKKKAEPAAEAAEAAEGSEG
jgi:hypothetical protein